MPNKEPVKAKTEREQLIEQLRAQVETAERRGHYDTAHHEMLKQLLSKE
jgi:hypothetical protein